MPERAFRNAEQDVHTLLKMNSGSEALVFDFDGVIADTEPLYWRAWCELLKPYAVTFEWDEYCRIGRGIRDEKMLPSLAEIVAGSRGHGADPAQASRAEGTRAQVEAEQAADCASDCAIAAVAQRLESRAW